MLKKWKQGREDWRAFVARVHEVYGKKEEPGVHTYHCVTDMAYLCTTSVGKPDIGCIGVVPAQLERDGITTDVYLISLAGTEFVKNQATNIGTDFRVAFERDNAYLRAIVKAITENIPQGANLFFVGISLGGMVSQQAAADERLKSRYNILHVLAVGSPLICPDNRMGTVRRIADKRDLVPHLSVASVFRAKPYRDEEAVEDGGYKSFVGGHALSYVDADVWKDYDVLGYKNGSASITYDNRKLVYYFAPLRENP